MKLLQIYAEDLAELESILPELQSALYEHLTPRLRMKLRAAKKILSDIRWDYGPPSDVEAVPHGGEGEAA